MKKTLYALVALVVIAVLAALVGPSFVDWQDYKAEIARELETATGRRVAIDGDVSLRLLPAPSLRANGVRIANVKGGSAPELARVGTLQMDLALWPLITGRIVGTGVVLIKPQISLEILADGKPNWLLQSASQSFGERQLIDNLTLRGGTIRYRNRALGQDVSVNGSEISISGGEPGAPYLIRGSVQAGRSDLTARGSFTRRSGGLYAVLLDVAHLDSASRFRYTGVASLGDRGPRLSGKVTLSGDRPHQFVRALAPKAELAKGEIEWLKERLSVTADLTVVGTEASIGGLRIRLGDIEATGQLDASLTAEPQYRVALAFNRLDLDAVMTRMASGAGKSLSRLPVSSSTDALTVEVKVNALIFRKEIIRDLHLRGKLEKGLVQLHSLTAQLPGAADLQLAGGTAPSQNTDYFAGGFTLSAGNLRGTLDWLGLDTSRVPASRLRRASASGRLNITRHGITFLDTKLDVDTSQIEGKLGLRFGKRPRLSINVGIDRLDVSAYVPRERPQPVASAGTQEKKAEKQPEAGGTEKSGPAATDLNLRKVLDAEFTVKVGQLAYAGRTASAAQATGTFERGVLTLTKAVVTDLGGLSGTIRGTIAEDEKQPKVNLAFDGRATAISGAMGLLGLTENVALDRLGAVTAKGTIAGAKSGAKLNATIVVAGGTARLDGDFVPSLSRTKYGFRFTLDHPRAEEIVTAFAPSGLPAETEIGPVRMSGLVRGDLAKASFPELKASVGGVELAAEGAIEVARIRPLITGEIKTGALTIEQLLAAPAALIASGSRGQNGAARSAGLPKEPIYLDGLKVLDATLVVRPAAVSFGRHKITEPKVEVELRDGVLDVKRASGRIFGGELSVRANLRSEKSTLVDAALTLRAADLARAGDLFPEAAFRAGKLDIDAALTSRGLSVYGLVAALNGTLKIKMRNGSIAGFDLAGINQRIANQADAIGLINLLTEGMSTGTTKFDRLDGAVTFVNGVGKVDELKLAADGGSATGAGTIALVPGRIDGSASFRFASIKTAPPLTVALSGPLDDLKAVFRFNDLQRHLMAKRAQKR